jgi:hypothetical protein
MQEVIQRVNSLGYTPGLISKVVTVDSPLHGVPPTEETIGRYLPSLGCVANGQAANELVNMYELEPNTTSNLQAEVRAALANGVSITTAGNQYDCVWSPVTCKVPFAGYLQTQWIGGSVASVWKFSVPKPCLAPLPACFIGTHGAVLKKIFAPDALTNLANEIGKEN